MKNKFIKIISAIIILICIGGIARIIISKNDRIADVDVLDKACFEFDKSTGSIVGYDIVCGSNVGIPSTIDDVKVIKIDTRAFSGKKITSLGLPDTLEEIGIGAFENNEIKELNIPNSVKNIKAMSFMGNKIEKLVLGIGITNIGIEAFSDNQLPDSKAFIYFRSESGEDKTMLIGYGGKNRDIVKIPEGVTSLYLSALEGNNINDIVLNEELERIEMNALAGNKITSLTIPSSVTIINDSLDYGLSEIIVKGKTNVEEFSMINDQVNKDIIKFD